MIWVLRVHLEGLSVRVPRVETVGIPVAAVVVSFKDAGPCVCAKGNVIDSWHIGSDALDQGGDLRKVRIAKFKEDKVDNHVGGPLTEAAALP